MSKFAQYVSPRPQELEPISGLLIAEVEEADVAGITSLTAWREGGTPQQYRAGIEAQVRADPDALRLFVARSPHRHLQYQGSRQVLGFGRVSRLEYESSIMMPSGWYLSGLIVSPEAWRRGIGSALTRHRMVWLASKSDADRVYYFANARNRATIDLHARFGFAEVRRGIEPPEASFEGGEGVLFEARPRSSL